MIRIVCFIKPHRLEPVKSAIAAIGISGMTVSDVRGTGNSLETNSALGGIVALPIRARIEVVLQDELQEEVLSAIQATARTGEPDDGKIFVEPVAEAIRVRTQERGEAAI